MNIRRVLAVTAIPFVISTFSFVAPKANAEAPSNRIASEQRPRPQDRPQRPDEKDDKRPPQPHHQKKRPPQPPHQKKRPPQPSHQKKRPPQPPHQKKLPPQYHN